jgi:hypothetical protein
VYQEGSSILPPYKRDSKIERRRGREKGGGGREGGR